MNRGYIPSLMNPPFRPAGYHAAFKRPLPFDQYLCEHFFPRIPEGDDTIVTQALLQRNQALMPTVAEQASINQMVSKVKQILDNVQNTPKKVPNVEIQEIREVGSFKKGIMMTKSNIADLVVILKTLPTVELVMTLGQKIVDELKSEQKEIFGCVSRPYGCEIAGTQAVVRIYVTIIPPNVPLLEPDLHMPAHILQQNMAMIRHSRWFEENGNTSTMKVLVRCLKDMKKRHEGFEKFNVWHIELIAHYAIHHTPNRQPLPLSHAFKRFLQLISTGILLPGSPSLSDPCDRAYPLNSFYEDADTDAICCDAQTLLRILCHGGINAILGNDSKQVNLTAEISIWDSVVTTPLEKAFGVDLEKMEEDFSVNEKA
uniref:DZF domain-containing protein n=1 Tax=Panagrolaimus superbus TaxID=310955 RepID=A0A914YQU4_9BILA